MRYRILLGIFVLISCSELSIQSQDPEKKIHNDSLQYKWERFSVRLGGFLTTMNSDISLNGQQSGLGININLENALGFKTSSTVIRGELEFSFGSRLRSHLRMGYFGIFRNSVRTLESEIAIGNSVFPIGADITSRHGLQIIRGLYDYSFYQDNRISFGMSAGMYVLPTYFSIGIGDQISESTSLIAPLPVVGARASILITPRFIFKQSMELLYLKTENFEGRITDLNVWLEYNPWKHLGLGLGYNSFNFLIAASGSPGGKLDLQGTLSTGFSGILFYGKFYF